MMTALTPQESRHNHERVLRQDGMTYFHVLTVKKDDAGQLLTLCISGLLVGEPRIVFVAPDSADKVSFATAPKWHVTQLPSER